MQMPAFDHSKACWDRYKAFHITHGWGLVQFDTGEVIITNAFPRPDLRKRNRHGFTVLHSRSDLCRAWGDKSVCGTVLKDPVTGEDIPNSWLTLQGGAGQYLLLDQETRRVVRLGAMRYDDKVSDHWACRKGVPRRFWREAAVYFAGNDMPPVGDDVTICRSEKLTSDERKHLSELLTSCRAWLQIKEVNYTNLLGPRPTGNTHEDYAARAAYDVAYYTRTTPVPLTDLLASDFQQLDPLLRFRYAWNGTSPKKEVVKREYLTF